MLPLPRNPSQDRPPVSSAMPWFARYGIAFATVAVALGITWLAPAIRTGTPFMFFFLAVALSALYGGFRVGLVAILLSLVAVALLVMPSHEGAQLTPTEFFQLAAFLLVSTIISWLVFTIDRARHLIFGQREQLRITLASIGDAVIATDVEGKIVWMNAVASELTGWNDAEAAGKPLSAIFHIVNEQTRLVVESPVTRVLAEGRIIGLANHTVLIAKDGAERPIDDSAAPIRDAYGNLIGVILIFHDISERKAAEIALQHLNATLEGRVEDRTKELEQINRELVEFTYVVSHDLRSPLRAITTLSNWIADDGEQVLSASSQGYLLKMQQRVRRMETLLNDLVAYTRAGRVHYKTEQVNLTELVNDVTNLLDGPVGFTTTVKEPMPMLVTERVPLETVLRNLIGNAYKHHHDAEHGHVEITAHDLGEKVEFAVSDDGPGIAGEFHARIFGVYQTLRPRDEVEGSGMGLAIAKRLVETRGGQIEVESAPGDGSIFRFTWPKQES